MQIQLTLQTLGMPQLIIDRPASFAGALVATTDEADPKSAGKRRALPPQFAGQVKELGDAISSVTASTWGH